MEDGQKIPLQKDCNPDDPEEAFLWMLVGIPGMKGAPLPFPVGYLRLVSRRLWDCGARPDASLQTIKYQTPRNDDGHWLTNPGRWVAVDEPDPERKTLTEVVKAMPLADQIALRKIVNEVGDAIDDESQ